ncbi:AhpC-TSA-domain-containing protein [Panus rudis PR-1116 ss-1]|nr:AhpC-TSA-domain-containing protein [Panus rudis PR-1116 ss-1]
MTLAETRRSSRIAAQPKKESEGTKSESRGAAKASTAGTAKSKRQPAKKRSVDDADGDGVNVEEKGDDAPVAKKSRNATSKFQGEDSSPAPHLPQINIGDTLPSLVLKNEKGEDIDVATLTADRGLVLFLVPRADTPGCTNQACGFRDIYPDFTALDFNVYCLSADSPSAQQKWQTKKELPYPLLSDPKRILITALGAGEGGKTKRSHFIFEKGGKLVDKKIPVKPVDSPKLALEFVKSLKGSE